MIIFDHLETFVSLEIQAKINTNQVQFAYLHNQIFEAPTGQILKQ